MCICCSVCEAFFILFCLLIYFPLSFFVVSFLHILTYQKNIRNTEEEIYKILQLKSSIIHKYKNNIKNTWHVMKKILENLNSKWRKFRVELYLVGHSNFGQNYSSHKIFVTYEKFCHFCSTKNFVHFQIWNSSKKTQFIYSLRDSPFLYHRNTYSTFQQLYSTRSHCPQSTVPFFSLYAWSLHYSLPRHPHHLNCEFAVAFSFSFVSPPLSLSLSSSIMIRLLLRLELLFHRRS